MSKTVYPVLILAVLAVVAPQAVAVPIVSLSSPNNLAQLTVGQTVHIDVTLSGLPDPNTGPNADAIYQLYTEVLFPSASFDPVSGPTGGPILPLPTGPVTFSALSSLTGGSALGIFDVLGPAPGGPISLNGRFYSFDLVATAAGSGVIQFDPADTRYAGTSSNFAFAPLPMGAPLAFTTIAGTAVVPEPSAVVMTASGVLMMGLGSWWRRRSRRRAARLSSNGQTV